MTYEEFINSKVQIAPKTGFDVADEEICTNLKPHQKIAVKWAIAGGRRAIFANFGLGKTVIQLEILHLITQHKGGKALIVAPFDVMPEFDNDAVNILKIAPPVFIRSNEEVKNNDSMLFITNYESVREVRLMLNNSLPLLLMRRRFFVLLAVKHISRFLICSRV